MVKSEYPVVALRARYSYERGLSHQRGLSHDQTFLYNLQTGKEILRPRYHQSPETQHRLRRAHQSRVMKEDGRTARLRKVHQTEGEESLGLDEERKDRGRDMKQHRTGKKRHSKKHQTAGENIRSRSGKKRQKKEKHTHIKKSKKEQQKTETDKEEEYNTGQNQVAEEFMETWNVPCFHCIFERSVAIGETDCACPYDKKGDW